MLDALRRHAPPFMTPTEQHQHPLRGWIALNLLEQSTCHRKGGVLFRIPVNLSQQRFGPLPLTIRNDSA